MILFLHTSTHCWTMWACGWRQCALLLAWLSSIPCSFNLKESMSSWLFSRKIPLPWFRPDGLQIHIHFSRFLTPGNSTKQNHRVFLMKRFKYKILLCLETLWMILFHSVLLHPLFCSLRKEACLIYDDLLSYSSILLCSIPFCSAVLGISRGSKLYI